MTRLNFQLEKTASASAARAARLKTLHGEVLTPVFMPVGTQATVKSQTRETLVETGSQVLLANTYHLLLRPGEEVFKKLGGIHTFMGWKQSVLTDSGGFQIFSLPHARDMTEEGARFRSYIDGKEILLSPEVSIRMQKAIGSDIMMVLDQCISSDSSHGLAIEAMERTHRWAVRSLQARGDSPQSLFAITQGACFEDLRRQSADFLTQMEFDGFAIGGLAVGETKSMREDFTELSAQLLPSHLPRYLMGVGTPIDILEAVHRGVDLFDCILPSSLAQRGVAFTSLGKLQLRRSVYKFSEGQLDPACSCRTCKNYSKAYLHHLIKADEILGWHLICFHNLTFYHQLMREIRSSILEDQFIGYYHSKKDLLQQSDPEYPSAVARRIRNKKTDSMTLGDYEVYHSSQGVASMRQKSSGEVMHSVNAPEIEAQRLYIDQSHLLQKFKEVDQPELVIWDVGLGAAYNSMSVLSHYEGLSAQVGPDRLRAIQLVSFENDLDSLKLALKNPHLFKHLRHAAPHSFIQNSYWHSLQDRFQWKLVSGDFLETLAFAAVPDLIFYDPFSYKTNKSLWSWDCFQRIFRHCFHHETQFFTYSASTAVRAGLLAAGFLVARGIGSGPKSETTIALTSCVTDSSFELLPSSWMDRWSRSSAQYPVGLSVVEQLAFKEKLDSHFQFHGKPTSI